MPSNGRSRLRASHFTGRRKLFEAPDETPVDLTPPEPEEPAELVEDDVEADVVTIEAEAEVATEETVIKEEPSAESADVQDAAGETVSAEPGPAPAEEASAETAPESAVDDGSGKEEAAEAAEADEDKKPVSVKDVTSGGAGDADEPIIFVPPRAPDDPGPEGELEADESRRS